MKKYFKPLFEEIEVITSDVLKTSNVINVNESNANFNNPDEII